MVENIEPDTAKKVLRDLLAVWDDKFPSASATPPGVKADFLELVSSLNPLIRRARTIVKTEGTRHVERDTTDRQAG